MSPLNGKLSYLQHCFRLCSQSLLYRTHLFTQSDGGTLADSSVSNCEEKVAVAVNKSVTVHDRETLREIIQLNFGE